MGGTTRLFNVPANKLKPGPTLQVVRQSDGLVTAAMTFTCRKFDYAKSTIQSLLNQGTRLTTLYPEAGSDFTNLFLDDWDAQDAPGGITTVSCRFKGISGSAEYSNEDLVTYTRNNSLREESILNHPKFLEQVTGSARETIRLGVDGQAYKDPSSTESEYTIKRTSNNATIEILTPEDYLWWWDYIVEKKNTTYLRATSEWTKSASGRGKLRAAEFVKFGKVDTPPGDPVAPTGDVWLYTGATEYITVSGNTVNSYTQTWTSGSYDETRVYSPT